MMLLLEFDSEKTIVKEEVMEAIVLIEDMVKPFIFYQLPIGSYFLILTQNVSKQR